MLALSCSDVVNLNSANSLLLVGFLDINCLIILLLVMGSHTGHRKAAHNELFIRNTAHISRYIRRIIKLFDEGYCIVA